MMALARLLHACIADLAKIGMAKHMRRVHQLVRRHALVPWPRYPEELTPYGIDKSVTSLEALAHHFPYSELVAACPNNICQIVDRFVHAELVVCTVIPEVFFPLTQHILFLDIVKYFVDELGGNMRHIEPVVEARDREVNIANDEASGRCRG